LPEQFSEADEEDWSPDGSRLASNFVTKDGKYKIGIALMDRETGTARQIKLLDIPGGTPQHPAWSADGRFLAYEAFSEGSWDVWIATENGADPRRLTTDPGNERAPVWSRDGKYLYFNKDDSNIYRIPMDTSGKPTGPAHSWARFPK